VAVVAFISVIVPVTLFLALRRDGEPIPQTTPSEAVSEIEKHDLPRAKAERGKNGKTLQPVLSAQPSAQPAPDPSASSSQKPPTKGGPPKR